MGGSWHEWHVGCGTHLEHGAVFPRKAGAWIALDPNIPPHVDPSRRTPIALKDKIQSELDNMVQQGVIRHIQELTEWVSFLTYITKKTAISVFVWTQSILIVPLFICTTKYLQ